MKILTSYILKQLIVSFLLILLGMTTLVWLTQSLRMIDMIVTKGIPVSMFLEMTLLVLPNFMQILSPIALFAVILFIFSRMQADKEVMVMQAIGMSNKSIMKPAFILAVSLTIVGYLLTLSIIPASHRELGELKWRVRNDLSHLLLQEGQFNTLNNRLTLYVKERAEDGSVKGVLAYDAKNPKNISVLIAEKGYIFQNAEGFDLVFQNGSRQEYNPETKKFSILNFDKYKMFFSDKKNADSSRKLDESDYPLSYLLSVTKEDVGDEIQYRKYKTEILKRLTKPIYNISFMFLAMFAILSPFYNRRGQMGRMNIIILTTILVQSLALAFENLTAKNLWFAPLMFLNLFVPVLIVYYLAMKPIQKPKIKNVMKNSFKLLLIATLCVTATLSHAQVKLEPQVKFEKEKPIDFEADEIFYNHQDGTVTAQGNVVIEQNKTIIQTDKFVYDKKNGQIIIPNSSKTTTPDGTVTFTADTVLSPALKMAVSNSVEMDLYEGSYMSAARYKRKENGDITYLKKATYTPCTFCKGEAPLWELTARTIKHNKPNKEMSFTHSFLKVKDIPVFYFPYLNIPDFTVKRKTGFLAPSFAHSNEMKQGINIPFFVDIADNQNLTIIPTLSTSHDPLGFMDYEGTFTHGYLKLQASGTRDNDNKNQGHIKAQMRTDISDKWRLSGQYYRVSSDTYFRRYSLPDVDTSDQYLESNISAERFGERNYFHFKGLSFQNQHGRVNQKSIPVFIPTMNYVYNTEALNNSGLYAFSKINGVAYNNRQRFKSNRASVTQGLHLPYISNSGINIDTKASIRVDGYSIDTGKYSFNGLKTDDSYSTGRFYPVFSSKISYPFAKASTNYTQVISPILMLVSAPVSGNKDKIPNVDSLDIDFDDTNLFSENRFIGYDRVETGTRANYGIEYSVYGNKKISSSFLFGQSYRFSGDEVMEKALGYESNYSDYVGRVQTNFDIFSLAYRFRLNKDDFKPVKNEITFTVGKAPLRVGVDYIKIKDNTKSDEFSYYKNREEILFFGSSQLTKNWSLSGYYRYNLEKQSSQRGPVESGLIAQYENDCTIISFELDKSFTYDRDYKGDTSFMVKFILKTLGGME